MDLLSKPAAFTLTDLAGATIALSSLCFCPEFREENCLDYGLCLSVRIHPVFSFFKFCFRIVGCLINFNSSEGKRERVNLEIRLEKCSTLLLLSFGISGRPF